MKKYIEYTHPSAREYQVDIAYEYDEVAKDMSLEDIKVFFSPIGFEWKDIEGKSKPIISK